MLRGSKAVGLGRPLGRAGICAVEGRSGWFAWCWEGGGGGVAPRHASRAHTACEGVMAVCLGLLSVCAVLGAVF